jgi:hypothetical protein
VDTIIVDELELAMASRRAEEEAPRGDMAKEMAQVPVDIKGKFGKPVIMVMPVEAIGTDTLEAEGARRNICDYFLGQGIPVYLTLERAAKALSNLIGYYEHRDAI